MSSTLELRETWKELLPEINRIAKEAAGLKTVARRLSSLEGYDALKKVQKDLERVQSLVIEPQEVLARSREALVPVGSWLDEEWTRRTADFAEDLFACFKDREVNLNGHAPDLKAGPLTIHIDTRGDQASLLYGDDVVRGRLPLGPERIFRQWKLACDALDKNSTAPRDLLAQMYDAYKDVLALSGQTQGRRIRLPDVHFQMFVKRQTAQVKQDPRKSRVKEYPRYQFAYDVGRMVREGVFMLDNGIEAVLHTAQKNAASSRSSSVQLDDGRGEFVPYSDVQFKEAGAVR